MELRRRWVTTGVTIVLLMGAAACSGTDDDPAATSADGSSAEQAPTPGSGTTASPRPGREGASQNPDEPNAGRELPDSASDSTHPPRPRSGPKALGPATRPGRAAATGRLVDGVPTALRPLPGSQVISSSVVPDGDRFQVAVEATSRKRPGSILRTYRIRMARHGVQERKVPAVGGSQAAGFRTGTTSITVTVTPIGSRTAYTVFGVVGDAGK